MSWHSPQPDPSSRALGTGPLVCAGLETLLPQMVVREPHRRVHATLGTVLCLEVDGLAAWLRAFEPGGQAGAQQAKPLLSEVIHTLTRWVSAYGGDTLELTLPRVIAFFPDEADPGASPMRSVAAALSIREGVRGLRSSDANMELPALHLRMGLSSGAVHGLLLGRLDYGQQVLFMGATREEAITMALQAGPDQIMLHPSIGVRLGPDRLATCPALPTPAVARVDALLRPPPTRKAPESPLVGDHTMLRWFFSPAMRTLLLDPAAQPDFRKVTFVDIVAGGVDPTTRGTLEALTEWYSVVEKACHLLEGQIVSAEVGQASRIRLLFGALHRRPDDEARALQVALSIQRTTKELDAVSVERVGVACGSAFVGVAGGEIRKSFVVLGERSEISIRLAGQAGPWEILVDRHTVSRAGFGFDWGPPSPAQEGQDVEGQTARVLYGAGAFGARLTSRSRGELLGREVIIGQLQEVVDDVKRGRSRFVSIEGRAGMGKTALVLWLGMHLQDERRIPVYVGECHALMRQASYHAWVPIIRDWFDLDPELPPADAKARMTSRLAALNPELITRLPLLGAVAGIELDDNATTRTLEGRQRRVALHDLLLAVFRLAHRSKPIALIFEDSHWMDDGSAELLRYLLRNATDLPIFILIARRPDESDESTLVKSLLELQGITRLSVSSLGEPSLLALACRHMGARSLREDLARLLLEVSGGVPLVLEEMALLLRDADQVRVDVDGVASRIVPSSFHVPRTLQDIVRLRVSRLDEGTQLTLKAASVIGRTFPLSLLQQVYPVPFDRGVLMARLERVEGLDIVRRDQARHRGIHGLSCSDGPPQGGEPIFTDEVFFFKHAIIRDTIYEMLTAAARRNLHEAVGQALEQRLASEHHDTTILLLAEHYRRTTCMEKQRQYYQEAGDVSRRRGTNRQAVEYYREAETLSHLAGDHKRISALLEAQVVVLNMMGDRDAQRETLNRWKELAKDVGDDGMLSDALRFEGALVVRIGDPLRGLKLLERARKLARQLKDSLREGRIVRIMSRAHFQQGGYQEALEAVHRAIELTSGQAEWKDLVSDQINLGTILARLGAVDSGRARLEDALGLAQEQGDMRLAGIVLSNLAVLEYQEGRYDQALRSWERALVLKRQVGERQEEALTLSNMSFAWHRLGGLQEALGFGLDARRTAREVEDRFAEANATQQVGALYVELNQLEEARAALTHALALAEQCAARTVQIETLEWLARLEMREAHLEAALRYAREAVSLGVHRRGHLLSLIAFIVYRMERLEDARRAALEAEHELEAERDPGEPRIASRLELVSVLATLEPERAQELREKARLELETLVARIEEPRLRDRIRSIEAHRALLVPRQ